MMDIHIRSDIYLIRCTETQKIYIGQTQTHTMQGGKYRPFGYMRRWKAHTGEAINNTKKKQCKALNNAIRKYGIEKFKVKLLRTCDLDLSNFFEKFFIAKYKSIAPGGYNLTYGGKTALVPKSIEKISKTVTEIWKDPKMREMYSDAQIVKNDRVKFEKYKLLNINKIIIKKAYFSNKDKYGIKCFLYSDKKKYISDFCGKLGSLESFIERSSNVCKQICENIIIEY